MQNASSATSRLDPPRRTSSESPVVVLKRTRRTGERGSWQGRPALRQGLPSQREWQYPHGGARHSAAHWIPHMRPSQSHSTTVEKCTRTAGEHGPWQTRPVTRWLKPSADQRRHLNGCPRRGNPRLARDMPPDRLTAGGTGMPITCVPHVIHANVQSERRLQFDPRWAQSNARPRGRPAHQRLA